MDQKRNQDPKQDMPNRASNMEKAEGSREQERRPERGRDAGRTSGGGSLGHDQPKDDGSSLKTQI